MDATNGAEVTTVDFDEWAGVGVSVQLHQAGARPYVGLTFRSALQEHGHDLTREQAAQLRDALDRHRAG